MPFYRLHPVAVRLSDRDWEASTHRGDCYVMAPGERAARESASAAFTGAAPAMAGAEAPEGSRRPGSPWLQPRLVEVTETGQARDDLAPGTVLVPGLGRS